MKKIFSNKKISNFVARIALSAITSNVNSTCEYYVHQPKLPNNAKKLRKF